MVLLTTFWARAEMASKDVLASSSGDAEGLASLEGDVRDARIVSGVERTLCLQCSASSSAKQPLVFFVSDQLRLVRVDVHVDEVGEIRAQDFIFVVDVEVSGKLRGERCERSWMG